MCAEFGFHQSMPIYSGGLGVLAGDILKEASDQSLEMIGIGLLYRRGYFRQRLDIRGRQQEYWIDTDPHGLPMARVTTAGGRPAAARGAAVRRSAAVPGLARRRRPDPAAPARRRAALERRGAAVDVGPPVRGEPGRAARAVRAARDRRCAGAPGARDRPGRSPSERGAPCSGSARARCGGDRARCPARGGVRAASGGSSCSRRTHPSRPGTRPMRPTSSCPRTRISASGSGSATRSSSTSAAASPASRTGRG